MKKQELGLFKMPNIDFFPRIHKWALAVGNQYL